MSILIPKVPDDYTQIKLYQRLATVSAANHDGLVANVDKLIAAIQPMLDTVGRDAFSDYTLHNPLHSRKLMHLAGYIIPDSVLNQLSSLELTVMIMSFYLHDLGMVSSYDDKESVLKSDEFQTFIDSKEQYSTRFSVLRDEISKAGGGKKSQLENLLAQLQGAALTDYLRPQHARVDRYNAVLKKVLDGDDGDKYFELEGVSFKKELLQICQSHNDSCYILGKTDSEGKLNFDVEHHMCIQEFNMQYCAAILRIADILDFDMERTPSSLFRALGIEDKQLPGFKTSLIEWTKQMAVHTISISDNEIVVKADCNSPSIEHAVREMCSYVEREIRDTLSIIRSVKNEITSRYYTNLPLTVKADIRSNGYTYRDYSIRLNDASIRNLLMGNNLYFNKYVAARELIQNSLDACLVRNKIEKYGYTPLVKVYISMDANNRHWFVVQDNGIGMDDKVLSDYFFKIGNSYYRSDEFRSISKNKKITDFTPSSRFGIGILSVFMIGSVVKVTTSNKYSVRGDVLQRTLIVDNTESLAVVQESPAIENGTKIEVLLHPEKDNETFINGMFGFIKETIIRPSVPVVITTLDKAETRIETERYYKFDGKINTDLEEKGIETIEIDLHKHSELLKGKAFLFFFRKEDGKLSFIDPKGKVEWGIYPLKTQYLLEGTATGSRVTVNGVSMSLKKSGGLFNTKKRIVPFLIDVDVTSKEYITFDVSRSKVNGKGLEVAKKEIYNSIVESLKDMGVYDRFDDDTRKQFKRAKIRNVPATPLDKGFLSKVETLLPTTQFSVTSQMIYDIADKLSEEMDIVKAYVYAVAQKYK